MFEEKVLIIVQKCSDGLYSVFGLIKFTSKFECNKNNLEINNFKNLLALDNS